MSGDSPWRRQPQLAVLLRRKVRRHHSDNVVRLTIEADVAAYNGPICGKVALPQAVAEYNHVIAAGSRVARLQTAPENRSYSKQRKEAGRGHRAFDQLRTISRRQASLPPARGGHLVEDLVL